MLFQMRRGSCERLQFSIGGKIVTIQQMAESVILVSKQVPIRYCVNASLAYILSSIFKEILVAKQVIICPCVNALLLIF